MDIPVRMLYLTNDRFESISSFNFRGFSFPCSDHSVSFRSNIHAKKKGKAENAKAQVSMPRHSMGLVYNLPLVPETSSLKGLFQLDDFKSLHEPGSKLLVLGMAISPSIGILIMGI